MLKIDANVAQTGLRVLFLIQLLIKGPISKAQIIEEISKNPLLKEVAPDTITLDINTLKSVGFDISHGNKGNNYCYELKLNPIKIKLSKSEIKALLAAKKAIFHFMDFRYIVSLYETFEKIAGLLESKEQAEALLNFGNILRTNFKILKELDVHARHKNEIIIFDSSPSGKKREMKVICDKLEYSKKNDKHYLWGECDEYGDVYLRTDHIKRIVRVERFNVGFKKKTKTCVYNLSSKSNISLANNEKEKILKITPEYVRIREEYSNDFFIKQKLLSYGENLISLEDSVLRKQLVELIDDIKEMYT